ncbi:MAG: ribosome-binding factor A [Bdellovibrionales bacterium GWA2_49_15]|nr:MAG: ribosome-binding factor A [Bdellovibrionales bacterium GWA2_49_15]HAZ12459.1 30S ribosome-binding factor RbfA [Bdellovibrionales bacterium]
MGPKPFKKDIFQEEILAQLNLNLRQLNDTRLTFVSVTKVELTPDCKIANVFWDTYDSSKRGDVAKAIESVKGKLRAILASELKSRQVPTLHFQYDGQFEAEQKITDILNDEHRQGKN